MAATKKILVIVTDDRRFMDLLEDTKRISEVNVEDYDAIYLTGGHGVMFDFPGVRISKA